MREKKSEHISFMIDAATEFWRLEKRVAKTKRHLTQPEGKDLLDQMQRIRDFFERYQVEIHDPQGEVYSDGRSLKAIYIEEVEHLAAGECRVIETVKPSISFKGVQISAGEVIVGQGKSKKQNKAA